MTSMQPGDDPIRLRGLLASWMAAVCGHVAGLLLAVLGQALGAVLGGCQWIGMSLPAHRQVWALVNEPAPHFAAQPAATGYWLGSVILPLLVALTAVPLLPRARSVTAELATLQLAWGAAVVGGAWLPLVEPSSSHLVSWLGFRRLPDVLVLVAPAVAVVAVVAPTLRLLAVARNRRRETRRLERVAIVLIHLVGPSAAWVGAGTVLGGGVPAGAAMAVLVTAAVSLPVAWIGYPPALVHRVEGIRGRRVLWLAALAFVLAGLVWATGRPLAGGRVAGILWRSPDAYDNIRSWIEPADLGAGQWRRVFESPPP